MDEAVNKLIAEVIDLRREVTELKKAREQLTRAMFGLLAILKKEAE